LWLASLHLVSELRIRVHTGLRLLSAKLMLLTVTLTRRTVFLRFKVRVATARG
jgi:hypothetical protein